MTVLDASAVLAWMAGETGGDQVEALLDGGVISTVNWSEIWQKLDSRGADASRALSRLVVLGLRAEPLNAPDAVRAAQLWSLTRAAGLSLADRCCLALAGISTSRPSPPTGPGQGST